VYSGQEDIIKKDTLIRELQSSLALKDEMKFDEPFYWHIQGDSKDGPFCAQCWDNDKKSIRLVDHKNGDWTCPTCKNGFTDSTWDRHPEMQTDYDPMDYV